MSKTAKALLAVQCALETPKAQVNEFGGFKYRSAEDILSALKPLLAEHKLLLTINDDLVQMDGRFYIKATVSVCHVEEENGKHITAYAREPEHKTKQDDAMVTGGSSSYARKYALAGMFLCDNAADPDQTHQFGKEKQPPSKKTPPKGPDPKQVAYDELLEGLHAYGEYEACKAWVFNKVNVKYVQDTLGGTPLLDKFSNKCKQYLASLKGAS